MLLWIEFIACTLAIVYSGIRLSRYGDIIAEKTGLGRAWIGVVLMASVTSLPELVTGISSVTYAGVPDIAVGDVIGSCVFNMLILAILDATQDSGCLCLVALSCLQDLDDMAFFGVSRNVGKKKTFRSRHIRFHLPQRQGRSPLPFEGFSCINSSSLSLSSATASLGTLSKIETSRNRLKISESSRL